MKNKMVKILLLVLCIILVAGCNKKSSGGESEVELRFKTHPEVKYNMYWKYDKDAATDIIELTKNEFVTFEENSTEANNTDGYTGEQVYTIEGLKQGKTTIIFQTYEPNGKTTHPEQKYKYQFTVDKNKNVKFKEVK